MRMKQLYLRLPANLRKLMEKRVVAMASAPRFRRNVRSAPAFSGRWWIGLPAPSGRLRVAESLGV
jgi:hypothetical protein